MNGVLDPAGPAAQALAGLSHGLIAAAALVFVLVMLLLVWALRARRSLPRPGLLLALAGVAVPALLLCLLFVTTLPFGASWKPALPPGALVIGVTAHQWWWELHYPGNIQAANELHIPVGRPVYLALSSADVIHSFWVPALAGKRDMLPGRLLHLELQADRAGVYRGVCAEFCGEQHGRMALQVVAEPPAVFEAWLRAQAAPLTEPSSAQQVRGRAVFLAQRCQACHAVRGLSNEGGRGPDLTHLGSRLHLAAATLPNTQAARRQWIAHVQEIKSGARMPSYPHLDAHSLEALADWLGSLR